MTMLRTSVGLRRRSSAALTSRTAELTGAMQRMLVAEIAEMRGDAQLQQLLRDSVEANVATVFSAIRHAIPIEKVELPTAALEHARRLAQRGVTVNGLVRAYRLGHKALLDAVLDEIRASNLEPALGLAVFQPDLRSHVRLHRLDHAAGGEHLSGRARPLDGEPQQPARSTGPGTTRRRRPRCR